MRGAALPSALLCSTLALALAFAPRRAWAPSLVALAVMATLVAIAPVHREWLEGAFLGCWVSVIACAVAVFLPGGVSARGALALSLNAGFWSGAVVAVAGSHFDLLMAVLCVLVVVPGAWIIGARVPIAVKVVSSWLIAVAILAATLQLLPVTPGYLPDHME